jgi:hypothetical protein
VSEMADLGARDFSWIAPTLEVIDARIAVASLLANARVDEGREVIHSFAHVGGIAVGVDLDLDAAVAYVDEAVTVAWVDHPLGHDLAVLAPDGRARYFQCFRECSADRGKMYR